MTRNILVQQCYQLACRRMLGSHCSSRTISRRYGHDLTWSLHRVPLLSHNAYYMTPRLVQLPNHQIQGFATTGSDTDSDDESLDTFLIENRDEKDQFDVLRNSLYPNSQDSLILQLNEFKTVQQVFSFLHKNQEHLNAEHVSQAVLVLWDLQKVFWQVCTDSNPEDNINELKNYIKAVSGHPDFECLLRLVNKYYSKFNSDALTCTLLYLGKMGVGMSHPTIQLLLNRCEKELNSFPLSALSRFMVSIHHGHLKSVAFALPALPLILVQIKTCENAEQFRLLTICLANSHQLVTPDVMNIFKTKVKYLLSKGILGAQSPKTVVKIISFLDFPRWSVQNSSLIRDLMHSISGQVSTLRIGDIIHLHRAIQSQLEPVSVLEEIQNYISQLLKERDPASFPVDVLACVVPFSSSLTHQKLFEDLLVTHIQSLSFPNTMPILFKILRYLKTANVQLCDLFWSETLKFLKNEDREDYKLIRISHKYMHFNNNLGGTYRHFDFETHMINWYLEALDGTSGIIPTRVARMTAFILGYGRTNLPPKLIAKIQLMGPQFSCLDCLNLSRGLQIATELRSKYRGSLFVDQIVIINSVLSSCIRNILSTRTLTLMEVNMLMRTYINMRGVSGTDLFEMLVNNYGEDHKLMSSRLLRDVTFNLVPQRCLVPSVMEIMAKYVSDHSCDLLGDTVEKILYVCYWLGYTPINQGFLQAAAEVIERHREKMTGLSLLQSALALCLMQHMPISLIHFIFTVDFLEQLDNEITLCYSKATYPLRVRQILMELNRSVCIDYPQADVPWFHTKYCQEQATQDTIPTSSFHNEVYKSLSSVVGGFEFVKKVSYTPYFYKLDFEVILDEHQKPLPLKQYQNLRDRQVTRIGVLLLRDDAFSVGTSQLRGPALIRRRHLEILNYRQVEISQSLWQAMYMTEEVSRQSFIQQQIWPQESDATKVDAHS